MVNKENTIVKLPFWETIKRSFLYPFAHIEAVVKITSVWFLVLIYEMVTGFPGVCDINEQDCQGISQLGSTILMMLGSTILMMLASVSIVVAFCRYIIIKEEPKMFQFRFGLREFKYIGYSILIGFFIFVPSILIFGGVISLTRISAMPQLFVSMLLIIALVFAIVILIVGTRLYLKLSAVAVDNKSLELKDIFEMTAGNSNRFFWAQVILAVPYLLVYVILSVIFGILGDAFVVKTLFTACTLVLAYFYSCITASFYSHAYQYFVYFADKKLTKASVAKQEVKESKVPNKKAPAKTKPKAKAETKPKAKASAKPKAKASPKVKVQPKAKTK